MSASRVGRQARVAWSTAVIIAAAAWPPSRNQVPARPAFQAGTLEGQVLLSPRMAARRPRFRLYAEYGQAPVPPAAAADTNEMANVVIYIDSALADGPPPPPGPREIRQVGEAFAPHVLAVPVGSTVNFPNKDPFFHNVFSLSKARTFDLGRYAQGASKSIRFDRAGVVQVFCHIHSDMSAVVFVAPSAFYGSPGPRGSYAITGIPPGTYRVTAWHERAKPITATIRILADGPTRHDFNIPIVDGEPGSH